MTQPRTPFFRFDGPRALIAGASSGIGAAGAVTLDEAGANAKQAARNHAKLSKLADKTNFATRHVDVVKLVVTNVSATVADFDAVSDLHVKGGRSALIESTFGNPERRNWIQYKYHLGQCGYVENIMCRVQYLASDAAALVTGTALMIDCGWTAE